MLSEEEKKAIEYYSNKEVSFSVDFDKEKLLKALGITEEDSFENHQIRIKTLLNLIAKLEKENETLKRAFDKQTADMSNNLLELQQKDKYIKDSEDITKEMGNDVNGLLLEIKEKDKQIDLMARAFKQDDVRSVEEIKRFFERKVKDEN